MASSTPKFYAIFLFLSIALLFSTWEVEAKLCKRYSTEFHAICTDTGICKNACIYLEHAAFGACHRDGLGFACFCYFNC
ncbi:Defensin-like protein [Medicago truncatula]|uniref:Defensin-like protein n=1 Tax=Medicago truncatula TaxID=3880 RepID=A0A072TLQ9_MEDTR|nr:Defensin-like protein [Medicago truncatula]